MYKVKQIQIYWFPLGLPVPWEDSLFDPGSSISPLSPYQQPGLRHSTSTSSAPVSLSNTPLKNSSWNSRKFYSIVCMYTQKHTCNKLSAHCSELKKKKKRLPLVKWRLANVFTIKGRGSVSLCHIRPYPHYLNIYSKVKQERFLTNMWVYSRLWYIVTANVFNITSEDD